MVKKFAEHQELDPIYTNREILVKWEELDISHESIDEREGCEQFTFFEGSPSVDGHPGIHHVSARATKDASNRYKTM